MIEAPYQIKLSGGLMSHHGRRCLFVRDEYDLLGKQRRRTKAGSNDYFATLATWLDEICLELNHENRREIAKLQRIVDDLLYLYTHYEIKKKR